MNCYQKNEGVCLLDCSANSSSHQHLTKTGISSTFDFHVLFKAKMELQMDNYVQISKIGSGSFGTVYKYERKEKSSIEPNAIAVKKCLEVNNIEIEILLKNQSHENLVKCFGTQETLDVTYIVMELCDQDLEGHLKNNRFAVTQDPRKIWDYCCQMASGLSYLHNHRIFHRDMKPANILVKNGKDVENAVLKIADFGISKLISRKETTQTTTLQGTLQYMAPEMENAMLKEDRPDKARLNTFKCDIFSLGLIYLFLVTDRIDEYSRKKMEAASLVQERIPAAPLLSLLIKMLDSNPTKRPTAEQVGEHLKKHGIDEQYISGQASLVEPLRQMPRTDRTGVFGNSLRRKEDKHRLDDSIKGQEWDPARFLSKDTVCALHIASDGILIFGTTNGQLVKKDLLGPNRDQDFGCPVDISSDPVNQIYKIHCITSSPCGEVIVCGTEQGDLTVLDARNNTETNLARERHRVKVKQILMTGGVLVVLFNSGVIRVYDMENEEKKELFQYRGRHDVEIQCCVLSEDGKLTKLNHDRIVQTELKEGLIPSNETDSAYFGTTPNSDASLEFEEDSYEDYNFDSEDFYPVFNMEEEAFTPRYASMKVQFSYESGRDNKNLLSIVPVQENDMDKFLVGTMNGTVLHIGIKENRTYSEYSLKNSDLWIVQMEVLKDLLLLHAKDQNRTNCSSILALDIELILNCDAEDKKSKDSLQVRQLLPFSFEKDITSNIAVEGNNLFFYGGKYLQVFSHQEIIAMPIRNELDLVDVMKSNKCA